MFSTTLSMLSLLIHSEQWQTNSVLKKFIYLACYYLPWCIPVSLLILLLRLFSFYFFLYGLYSAATEGITKAWISNIAHDKNTATAIGFYTSCQSICTLFASIIAGALWSSFGSYFTFIISAGIAAFVFIYFSLRISSNGY